MVSKRRPTTTADMPRRATWREWTAVIGWGRFVRPSKARQVASRCPPASSPAGCCSSSMAAAAAAALGVAVRRMHAAAQPPRLTKLALHPPKSVEVEFTDDSSFHLSAEFLRVYSPAADSKIRSIAGEKPFAVEKP